MSEEDKLIEITKLINEVGTTAKIKRNILVLKYGFSWEQANQLVPDRASDY